MRVYCAPFGRCLVRRATEPPGKVSEAAATRQGMTATHHRSGGSHTANSAPRRTEPDDVARPEYDDRPCRAEDLAAQPHLPLLQVDAASGSSGRAATNLASFDWNDHEDSRHGFDGRFGRETSRGSS